MGGAAQMRSRHSAQCGGPGAVSASSRTYSICSGVRYWPSVAPGAAAIHVFLPSDRDDRSPRPVDKHLRVVLRAHLAQPSLHGVAVAELRLLPLETEQATGQTLRDILRPGESGRADPATSPCRPPTPACRSIIA
jgi:hypothetical protein